MKKIIWIIGCCFCFCTYASAPSTSCPSGYVLVNKPGVVLQASCSSGYIDVGSTTSCLQSSYSSSARCTMYAPAGVSYTDGPGIYEFTDVCPME